METSKSPFLTWSPSLTGRATISPATSGLMAIWVTGWILPLATTISVMLCRDIFSVCTVMGGFLPWINTAATTRSTTTPTMMNRVSLPPFLRFLALTAAIMGGGAAAVGGERDGAVSIVNNSLEKWTIVGELYHGDQASFHGATRMRQLGDSVKHDICIRI